MSSRTDGHQKITGRTELHHRGAIRIGNPNVVFGIHSHAVGFVLMADHVIADLQNQFLVRIEFVKLRTSGSFALKHPEIAFRIESDRRHTTCARRQNVRIGERVTERLLPLDALQCLPPRRDPILANRFLEEVYKTLALLERFPNVGGPLPGCADSAVRQLPVDTFPYRIVFKRFPDRTSVLAIAHERRRPGYWNE